MNKVFSQSQLQAIAGALGDTEQGLTGPEIGHLLQTCRMNDPTPAMTKRHRLYNAFAEYQNQAQERVNILGFIRKAMRPERFSRMPEKFEPMRANLNQALAFAGLAVDASGTLISVDQAKTLTEARQRADELRADLLARSVHPDVIAFCREELLADNYFHTVLEATKSIADKIRTRTGLTDDGGPLVDKALGGDAPMLAINSLRMESEKSEQKGFANLVKGIFGMFRNPTAHAPRVNWVMEKSDAEDLLSLVSLVHRRLDKAHKCR
jgi:uncharacterized protein (TIGR02391 family)